MHLAGGHLQLSTESATTQCLEMSDGKPTAASATWNMEGPASEGGCTSDAECTPQGMLAGPFPPAQCMAADLTVVGFWDF